MYTATRIQRLEILIGSEKALICPSFCQQLQLSRSKTWSVSSVFAELKSKLGIGPRRNKSKTNVALCSHARESDGVVLSADAGNGESFSGKEFLHTFSSHLSSLSVIVCVSWAKSIQTPFMTYVIYLETDCCVLRSRLMSFDLCPLCCSIIIIFWRDGFFGLDSVLL